MILRRRHEVFRLLLLLCALLSLFSGCRFRGPESSDDSKEGRIAPLLENIGNLHHEITTDSEMAQRFFNQGLTLYWGFNHEEANRSFQEVARLDPDSAMAYWGQSLALGPNINDPLADPDRLKKAYALIQEALKRKSGGSAKEQALIDALTTRYSSEPAANRDPLNQAYATAMLSVNERFNNDPDVAILAAEAVMDTMPWDYWIDGARPKQGVEKVLTLLESVIRTHPNHPGAHHLYIHAVEASNNPDRAVPSAETLGGLVPVAGHLVHMPGHIFIRVGRYADAAEANRRAILADEDYIAQCRAQGLYPIGYYPHNIHFLWAALVMQGRSQEAGEAAKKVAAKHTNEHLHQPGLGFTHLFGATPMFSMVRFGQWQEILKQPKPAEDSELITGIWHWARGLAYANLKRSQEAMVELENVRSAAAAPALAKLDIFGGNTLDKLLAIAAEFLAGEIAAKQSDFRSAVDHFQRAVKLEDALKYSEPPDWPLPVRHWLGSALLDAGRFAEAEQVYRADLNRHRENGWSLAGLVKSLEAQGKKSEAVETRQRLQEAWKNADIAIEASRL
jgi:tetratricopeptide (TPR) repeat protein